ncbi:MAG: hypothetical protein IPM23_01640 [Candidatus Melainabacteria bacterium]|nr:hypothetical protein [Candidatus Melainabacteria bacterium]
MEITLSMIAVCATITVLTFAASAQHWVLCLRIERSWKEPTPTNPQERARRERRRLRSGIAVVIGYALVMVLTNMMHQWIGISGSITIPFILAVSVAFIATNIRNVIHYWRISEVEFQRNS